MKKHLLSQLAHVELLSPRPTETVAFLEQQLGLEISERCAAQPLLRQWQGLRDPARDRRRQDARGYVCPAAAGVPDRRDAGAVPPG